jgi:type II secretory pathway pseudopilin PulG
MLVVVTVIGILAALLVAGFSRATQGSILKSATASRKAMEMAIGSYQGDMGHLPPDNPGDATGTNMALTPLFYELTGTRVTNGASVYVSLVDQNHSITSTQINSLFKRGGFDNASEEVREMKNKNFHRTLKSDQFTLTKVNDIQVYLMTLPPSANWNVQVMGANPLGGGNTSNPWF